MAQNSPSGAHFVLGDNHSIQDCTFANNSAYAIGLFQSNSNAMNNTIVWGNAIGGVFNDGSSSLSVSYSDHQDGALGAGNINADPGFLAPPADLRPGPGSPVVDAGNNAAVPVGVTTDVAGLPRFFNDPAVPDTGAGTPPIVDMGAHERVPLSVSAPASLDLCAGDDAGFSVTAQGQPTLTYQWIQDGTPLANGGRIAGADTDTLTVSATIPDDAGDYAVVVTDGLGQALTSAAAALTVAAPAQPTITAPLSVPVGSTGSTASVVNNPGSTWDWTLSGGTITAGQGTNQITFDAGPPGTTMLGTVTETAAGCVSPAAAATIQVDFLDVPPGDPFHDYVISVARAGITAGCGGGNYCRNNPVTRAQMAVFLLKAEHGASYSPPACQSVFSDVPCPSTFANWIEQLAAEGITGRLRRRDLLPERPGDAAADGGLPAEDGARIRLHAPRLPERLRGRRLSEPLRQLDRAALRRERHGRLLDGAASLLPDEPEHARPDGRVPGEDVRSPACLPSLPPMLCRGSVGRRIPHRPAIFRAMPEPIPIPSAVTPVRRALVSVHDKTGLAELGRALAESGIQLVSTGGTAATLKAAGVEVSLVEEKTGFPEILGGRVKTLHPKVFGGVLADETREDHARDLEAAGIETFDLVSSTSTPSRRPSRPARAGPRSSR